MPIKNIGKLITDNHVNRFDVFNYCDIFISTSDKFRKVISNAFGVPIEKVLVSGQPCQDIVLSKKQIVKDKLGYRFIVTYSPTFRKTDNNFSNAQTSLPLNSQLQKYFSKDILQFFFENNILLLFKFHPMEYNSVDREYFSKFSNVCFLEENSFIKTGFGFYDYLRETDVLISDLSSIIIDYAVKLKPIIVIMDDIEEYIQKTGTVFENYLDILPGPLVGSSEMLYELLSNILIKNEFDFSYLKKFNNFANLETKVNTSMELIKKRILTSKSIYENS